MPIINLADETKDTKVRALFIGQSGRGKTVAAASWPGRTLVIDFDKRSAPIKEFYDYRKKDYDIILVSADNFWDDFKPIMDRVLKNCPYQNIIVDSVTSFTTCVVVMQMLIKGAYANLKDYIGKADKGKVTGGGIGVPTWDEFNGEAMVVTSFFETIKSLDVNLFVSAHPVERVKIKKDQPSVTYQSLVTFGPKVESMIMPMFDEVWYFDYLMDLDQADKQMFAKRTVYTGPTAQYAEAKTAIKGLPISIDITNREMKPELTLYSKIKPYL